MKYLEAKDALEKYLTLTALNQTTWNLSAAGRDLGISKQAVFKIIKKFELKRGMRPPDPSAFIRPERSRSRPIRRIVLFEGSDFVWLKSKEDIASYSKLIRAALRLLKKKTNLEIHGLI